MSKRKRKKPVRRRERDARGWRVPREGSLSRAIYDGIASGKTPLEISRLHGADVGMVRVLAHRFRNPDWRS